MAKVREFHTGWEDGPGPRPTFERDEADLIGTAAGHLLIPCFRPFDFLAAANQPLTFLDAASSRLSVEALRGTQPVFHRNIDFDELFFQWAGRTIYQTEAGIIEAEPGELLLVPGGIAHRATGSADCLRLSARLHDPLTVLVTEAQHVGRTRYEVTWQDGPIWPIPPGGDQPQTGRVIESLHTWDDRPEEQTLIERDYERIVGCAGGPALQKLRLFDIFTEITGVRGPGPVSMKNAHIFVECYNTTGAQFAFHRGNRTEEFQLQFCGRAENISEFGTDLMDSGDLAIVRRGISHRVIGSPNFRRMNLYSNEPWRLLVDPRRPLRKTTFAVRETVIEAAPWRNQIHPA